MRLAMKAGVGDTPRSPVYGPPTTIGTNLSEIETAFYIQPHTVA